MKCIDFDKEFQRYLTEWLKQHRNEYKTYDQMEAKMPDVYAAWLDTPLSWLGSRTPGNYFDQFDNPVMLVNHLEDYVKQRVPVPDTLMNRLADMGEEAENAWLSLLNKEKAPQEAKMLAITGLREIGSEKPLDMYVSLVSAMKEEPDGEDSGCDVNELAENALESLQAMGEKAVDAMRLALDTATVPGRESFCSLLCHYEDRDQKVFGVLMEMLRSNRERCAVLADFLGKLGNPEALEPLRRLAASEETGYLDYIELRAAIEALGGEAPMREFDENDPAYEAMCALEARKIEEGEKEHQQ